MSSSIEINNIQASDIELSNHECMNKIYYFMCSGSVPAKFQFLILGTTAAIFPFK